MKKSGVEHIDKEFLELNTNFKSLIRSFELLRKKEIIHKDAKKLKSALNDFRYDLAYNRGTEHYETKYGWSSEFEKMFNKLDNIIESTKDQ